MIRCINSLVRKWKDRKENLSQNEKIGEENSADNNELDKVSLNIIVKSNIIKINKNVIENTLIKMKIPNEYINAIIIHKIQNCNGKVEIESNCDQLKFRIYLSDSLIKTTDDGYNELLSTFQHELFHCEEMIKTSLSMGIDNYLTFRKKKEIVTWKQFIIDLGYSKFSEYYAYYNNCREYDVHDVFENWEERINMCNKTLMFMVSSLQWGGTMDSLAYRSGLNDIKNIINATVAHAAYYAVTNDYKYIKVFEDIKEINKPIYDYFQIVQSYLLMKYDEYPKWINNGDGFIEIGKELLRIFEFYGLKYFDNDINENINEAKLYKL